MISVMSGLKKSTQRGKNNMKKIIILVCILFLSTTVHAVNVKKYKLSYSSNVAAAATAQSPDTCQRRDSNATLTTVSCDIPLTGAVSLKAQLDTTDANNTATATVDLNFLYGDDTESYECGSVSQLADNKKKSCLISVRPGTMSFNIDCATDVCRPIIWVDVEK